GPELRLPGREILGDAVDHLGAGMGRHLRPGPRLLGRFHRIADVLAVAQPRLAGGPARGIPDREAIARIRPCLPAADVELRGAVDRRGRGRVGIYGGKGRELVRRGRFLGPFSRARLLPGPDEIFMEAFAAALAAEAAL